jgi:hypothetical protein
LRHCVRLKFWSQTAPCDKAEIFYLAEYNRRAQMKAIGYTDSMENLDALTGELFALIADEMATLEEAKREQNNKKGKR